MRNILVVVVVRVAWRLRTFSHREMSLALILGMQHRHFLLGKAICHKFVRRSSDLLSFGICCANGSFGAHSLLISEKQHVALTIIRTASGEALSSIKRAS